MIFVTVGSMFPFDRMIRMVDNWAAKHPNEEITAQVGAGAYEPRNMRWSRILPPDKYKDIVHASRLIIAHAGTGSVFTASELRVPIVLVPRRAANKEHTTDHQLDTAKWLEGKPGIFVVWSDDELDPAIDAATRSRETLQNLISAAAPESFVNRIRQFLLENGAAPTGESSTT